MYFIDEYRMLIVRCVYEYELILLMKINTQITKTKGLDEINGNDLISSRKSLCYK